MQKYRHIVQYYETDKMGITHHSNYIRWMEEARIDFLRQIGWDYAKLESIGIISPVIAVNCKYKKSTTFEDVIDIDVIVEEFKEVKLKLQYTMTNAAGRNCMSRIFRTWIYQSGRQADSVKKRISGLLLCIE